MSDLEFFLLVIGVPVVCVACVLVFARADAFHGRHPTVSWVLHFSLAGYFVAMAVVGFFSNPPRNVSSVIGGALGVVIAIRTSFRLRAQKISDGSP